MILLKTEGKVVKQKKIRIADPTFLQGLRSMTLYSTESGTEVECHYYNIIKPIEKLIIIRDQNIC
jgi:hypothetical protein